MIFMLCNGCNMDMMVLDIQYVPTSSGDGFKMIYHVGCENKHMALVDGDLHKLDTERSEYRIIQYLIEQSERRYGKTTCN